MGTFLATSKNDAFATAKSGRPADAIAHNVQV
jgi:hypothetical protein